MTAALAYFGMFVLGLVVAYVGRPVPSKPDEPDEPRGWFEA